MRKCANKGRILLLLIRNSKFEINVIKKRNLRIYTFTHLHITFPHHLITSTLTLTFL